MRFNVVDLFSGVGGLSYGFSKLPEFQIVIANEKHKDIATAYSLNHPNVKMFNCDIEKLTDQLIMDTLAGSNIDLVVGGPPCQSYSTLGKREMDHRSSLFLEYKRILQILNPRAFVFENVVGILSINKGKLFEQVKEEFRSLGYELEYKVLNAVDFGVPQHRERVILVGMKEYNNFVFPVPTQKQYVTLKDAIGDLPSLQAGESKSYYAKPAYNDFLHFVRGNAPAILTEHDAPKSNDYLTVIMQTLQDGQSKADLPASIRPPKGFPNTYAKLWWEKPATTITRNFACPSSSRCIHPKDSRAMTIREGARLQSFPDDYKFFGTKTIKRLQIGNAVPPLLSIEIAKSMRNALYN